MNLSIESMFGVQDKVIVLSGGAGGIASGIARILGTLGAKINLIDLNESKLTATADDLRKTGIEVSQWCCDISDKEQVSSVVNKAYEKYGSIDSLLNCAGVSWIEEATEFNEDKWDLVINVNLKGTFLLCQAVGKYMLKEKAGRIVNFSSVRGLQGRKGDMAYAPSKGAINQLTRSLAIEWATAGINVNAIAPTFTLTDMNREQIEDKHTYEWITSRIPKNKLCTIEELVGPVIFLLSPASEFVTGQILYVDGGWTAA